MDIYYKDKFDRLVRAIRDSRFEDEGSALVLVRKLVAEGFDAKLSHGFGDTSRITLILPAENLP